MSKISVIIPVYNVEKYIIRCLDSISNQTFSDIEIICIDDGSTDNSVHLIENYQKKDDRIILIKNEINKGASYSRNIGIKKSSSEYITFVDSDDYVNNDYLECLYLPIYKNKYDIVFTSTFKNTTIDNDILIKYDRTFGEYNFNKQEYIDTIRRFSGSKFQSLCYSVCKLYNKNFLIKNNIYFSEKIFFGEDLHFFIKTTTYNPTFYRNNNAIYYYRSREGQMVRKLNIERRTLDHIYIYKDLLVYINSSEFSNSLLTYIFNNIYEDCKGDFRYKNNFLNLKSYLNKFDYNISENIKNVYLKKICLSVYFDDEEEGFKKYKLYNFILNSIRKYMPPFVLTYLRKHDIIPRIY
ncbi:glycosyltransferase family 2 protein [Brachyspira innocens]|uniref:glycosyltransferase family 2 protein n=1 Tax=Brachyspira innocens TaxID=13264 RepID=UPI0003606B55|nr:glycosyltransferase family 2 protein [Brachyspira innocens]